MRFPEESLHYIIQRYTRKTGVRNLERAIGTVCRKHAREVATGNRNTAEAGRACTPVGGDVLFVEAGRMPGGSKGLIMTGQLGAVMQESIQAALTWVRAQSTRFGIDPDVFKQSDIHVDVPSGAIPKDGPSAGATVAMALISALTGRRVNSDYAMTGEITLTGLILPVGGMKEKILAAKRSGIQHVIVPEENEANLKEDLKSGQLGGVRVHFIRSMEEVVTLALLPAGQ